MYITDHELVRLHFALRGIEAHRHDKESMALRRNILRFYGVDWFRLRQINLSTLEPTQRRPSIFDILPENRRPIIASNCTMARGIWRDETARQTAARLDPWRHAKEAKRRKDEIRRTMSGEYSPPWFNEGGK